MAVTFGNNRVMMLANADTYAPNATQIVTSVTISKPTAAKYYRLYRVNASGQMLWEYPAVTTADNIYQEHGVNISTAGGLFLSTDDAGTDFRVFLTLGGS